MDSIKINNDTIFYIDSDDPVISYLKRGTLYGENNYRLLDSVINKDTHTDDMYLLDCGAHIGTFSLPASKSHNVICVEGAPENAECLRKTFASAKNVEVVEAILHQESKRCSFSHTSGPFGWIVENPEGEFTTKTIDEIVGDRKICGIKLDIEGSELFALNGAQKTLEQKPPMLIEINGHCLRQFNLTPNDVFETIESYGYKIYFSYGKFTFKINKAQKYPFCVSDVTCLHVDNLANYQLSNVIELCDEDMASIYEMNYLNSNNDCKVFFESYYK